MDPVSQYFGKLVAVALISGAPVVSSPLHAQLSPPEGPSALTLEEALRLSREHNPDFLIQGRELESAEIEAREAWGDLLPTANITNSYGLQTSGERRFGDVVLGDRPEILSSSYNFGVSLSLNGSTLLRPRQAQREVRASEARTEGAGMGLRAEVTDAYLAGLQADAEVSQARAELERTLLNVREAQARVDVGAATPLDVRRTEVQHGQAEVRLVQVENQAASARVALARLLGLGLPDDVALTTSFDLFEPHLEVEELVGLALDGNPVLQVSRLTADVAEGNIRAARTQYLPSLTLSASVNASVFQAGTLAPLVDERLGQQQGRFMGCVQDNRIRELLGDPPQDCGALNPADPGVVSEIERQVRAENRGFPFSYNRQPWNLSLSLSLPLFTGLSRGRQVEQARISHANAREQVRSEELRLRAEVSQAARSLETAFRTVELQGRVREISSEELRLAQERFRLGLASSIEVADAQANLSQAERDEITAVYEFHRSAAALEALVGRPIR
jgi:outer membrane protein